MQPIPRASPSTTPRADCAHVKITANDSLPIDEGWPAQQSATDQ